jgi:dienelactone hydrolase
MSNSLFKTGLAFSLFLGLLQSPYASAPNSPAAANADSAKRKVVRDWVIKVLPPDFVKNGNVSVEDKIFTDWTKRTGELPPDFERMPSIPFLPNPLVLDEGGKNIPVKTAEQWKQKRKQMEADLRHYVLGSFPPAPTHIAHRILSERKEGEITLRMVELSFGPENKAKLTLELMIPPGNGPFPVFLTQWNHREWAQIAVRRGYMTCVYAAADAKDDSEAYAKIWWPKYDFALLGRRVYATSRAIDYLYTLPIVDKAKIGLTGHSRNGKLSLMAAAFDDRIAAVNTSSSGTGGEVPWRYATHAYDIEDLALLTCAQPAWFHPRLRYFLGREDKLPVDQHSFMALVAPRGLMLSTAVNEYASNPWGIEQAYHSVKPVYSFLGKENNLSIRSRAGKHSVSAKDLEDYIDFFDYVFGRSSHRPESRLNYPYSFEQWKVLSGQNIKAQDYPAVNKNAISLNGKTVSTLPEWEQKKASIIQNLVWALGTRPAGVKNPGPGGLDKKGGGEDNFGTFIARPSETEKMKVMPVSPYHGFGDNLFGYLYYPADKAGKPASRNLPVVIYLHEFDYSKGFGSTGRDHQIQPFFERMTSLGFAVFSFDMIGFGNRIEEGTRFYQRYPQWSKLDKMVTDTQGAIDALEGIDFLNGSQIYLAGYSLGATVGLYTAALDQRVKGVASVAGFTPLRSSGKGNIEGVKSYSHLHGLLPKLGFFVGNETRIPYDYHEVLASIAPRPLLVIAPEHDKDHPVKEVRQTVELASEVYRLYQSGSSLQARYPEDHNRFSDEIKEQVYEWFAKLNK